MTLFVNSQNIYYIPHKDHINKTDQKILSGTNNHPRKFAEH